LRGGGLGCCPAGSVVRIGVKMPEASPGCWFVTAGWVGLNAAGSEAEVVAAGPISAPLRLVMQCRVSLVSRCGSVADAPGWVNVGVVPEPRVELEAVRSSFPLRCGLSGWRIDGSVMRRITVTGPVAGEAVWTLNHLPAAALAGSAAVSCCGGGGPKGAASGRWSPRRLATGGGFVSRVLAGSMPGGV